MFDRVLNTPLKLDVRQKIKSLFKNLLDWSGRLGVLLIKVIFQ